MGGNKTKLSPESGDDNCCRCSMVSANKGPLQTKGPCKQRAPANKGPLQTKQVFCKTNRFMFLCLTPVPDTRVQCCQTIILHLRLIPKPGNPAALFVPPPRIAFSRIFGIVLWIQRRLRCPIWTLTDRI